MILKEFSERSKGGKIQGDGKESARLTQLAVGMDGGTKPSSEEKAIPEGGRKERQSKEDVVR